MENYLVLEFKNAKFFKKHKATKDFVFDLNGKRQRVETLFYKEPINVHHVSNVLHVLFGQRPKPSLREVAFGNVEYYYQKALESYLFIDSHKVHHKKNDTYEYVGELSQMKKVAHNSWSKSTFISWNRISKNLGEEFFNEFIKILSELFEVNDIRKKYNLLEVVEECLSRNLVTKFEDKNSQKTKLDIFFDKLVANKKSPLVAYFTKPDRKLDFNMSGNTKFTIHMGIERVFKINGEIVVPVSDEDISKLRKNKGCATILDGGLVFIKGIFPANRINISNEHRKVSEISLDKY